MEFPAPALQIATAATTRKFLRKLYSIWELFSFDEVDKMPELHTAISHLFSYGDFFWRLPSLFSFPSLFFQFPLRFCGWGFCFGFWGLGPFRINFPSFHFPLPFLWLIVPGFRQPSGFEAFLRAVPPREASFLFSMVLLSPIDHRPVLPTFFCPLLFLVHLAIYHLDTACGH